MLSQLSPHGGLTAALLGNAQIVLPSTVHTKKQALRVGGVVQGSTFSKVRSRTQYLWPWLQVLGLGLWCCFVGTLQLHAKCAVCDSEAIVLHLLLRWGLTSCCKVPSQWGPYSLIFPPNMQMYTSVLPRTQFNWPKCAASILQFLEIFLGNHPFRKILPFSFSEQPLMVTKDLLDIGRDIWEIGLICDYSWSVWKITQKRRFGNCVAWINWVVILFHDSLMSEDWNGPKTISSLLFGTKLLSCYSLPLVWFILYPLTN